MAVHVWKTPLDTGDGFGRLLVPKRWDERTEMYGTLGKAEQEQAELQATISLFYTKVSKEKFCSQYSSEEQHNCFVLFCFLKMFPFPLIKKKVHLEQKLKADCSKAARCGTPKRQEDTAASITPFGTMLHPPQMKMEGGNGMKLWH